MKSALLYSTRQVRASGIDVCPYFVSVPVPRKLFHEAQRVSERILYLVRHGQLDLMAFAENQFAAGLTAIGREQAKYTGKTLRSLDVSSIYSSTLGRARETAAIIAREFPRIGVRPSNLLWELPNVGPITDQGWRTVFAKGKQRGERAFVKYVRPTRQKQRIEILVSHGNLIRYFACRVLGIEPESWSCLGSSHCGITELRIGLENHARIIRYNEIGHLPTRLRT
jgi:serine/threonine-protein phosphatase PGAM5